MTEIEKLALRIKNTEKYKSNEIRISLTDAKLLLDEIIKIQTSAVVDSAIAEVLIEEHVMYRDAGKFSS